MHYFDQDYLNFFKELAPNNNKDWFDRNRKRYENVVRDPFKKFVTDLIQALAEKDPELNLEAKNAIFRINRDIRFSKDKTPYKLNNSAIISSEGRKNKNHPGIYIEFGPEKLAFYGGIYMPDTKQTLKLRSYFAEHKNELLSLLEDADFKDTFGEIHGEKSKRIPKELREVGEELPLIWNKQWYYYCHLSPEIIIGDQLLSTILDLERKADSMKEFLSRALYH